MQRNLLRPENKDISWDLDGCRRKIAHHFYQIKLLCDSGVVEKTFVKDILARENKRTFFLEVIVPLEKAMMKKAGSDYGHEDFDYDDNMTSFYLHMNIDESVKSHAANLL